MGNVMCQQHISIHRSLARSSGAPVQIFKEMTKIEYTINELTHTYILIVSTSEAHKRPCQIKRKISTNGQLQAMRARLDMNEKKMIGNEKRRNKKSRESFRQYKCVWFLIRISTKATEQQAFKHAAILTTTKRFMKKRRTREKKYDFFMYIIWPRFTV